MINDGVSKTQLAAAELNMDYSRGMVKLWGDGSPKSRPGFAEPIA